MALLRLLVAIPGLRLELPPGRYRLEPRDERNAAHLLNEPMPAYPDRGWDEEVADGYSEAYAVYCAWEPQWQLDIGPLQIAAGVTVVGDRALRSTTTARGCTRGTQRARASCRCTSRRA